MKVLKLGKVCIDGTKVKANASKHKALSYGHGCKLEKQLEAEVDTETMLIVTTPVTQSPNDKQKMEPALANLK
ncbi:MAG: hypothetical protein ACLQT6_19230 [Desulfomonilaceae bacterium]